MTVQSPNGQKTGLDNEAEWVEWLQETVSIGDLQAPHAKSLGSETSSGIWFRKTFEQK